MDAGVRQRMARGGTTALLKPPSAVMPFAYNYILNPSHDDVVDIKIDMVIEVRNDPRILRLLTRP